MSMSISLPSRFSQFKLDPSDVMLSVVCYLFCRLSTSLSSLFSQFKLNPSDVMLYFVCHIVILSYPCLYLSSNWIWASAVEGGRVAISFVHVSSLLLVPVQVGSVCCHIICCLSCCLPSPYSQFKLDPSELRQLEEEESSSDVEQQVLRSTAKRLPIANRTMAGNVRYCERCRAVKPDRWVFPSPTHHGRQCQILQMLLSC